MKTNIALIAAPWSEPSFPSIQIGALKAHLDRCEIPDVKATPYSAFIEIPYHVFSFLMFEKFPMFEKYAEYSYSLALIKRFFSHHLDQTGQTLDNLVAMVNRGREIAEGFQTSNDSINLTSQMIDSLIKGSEEYVSDKILSTQDDNDLNIYCFTLNYHQVTSSLFLAKSIQEKAKNKKNIFIFGGMSAAIPTVVDLMVDFDLPAFCVLGEGEKKLETIARSCAASSSYEEALASMTSITGVFSVSNPPNLWIKDKSNYEGQYSDLSELPIPDYKEYFDFIDSICEDTHAKERLLQKTSMLMEGTRGCFAKCTFCGFNTLWSGFRKMSHEAVVQRAEEHSKRYSVYNFRFVDNVCDTWAEGFANELIKKKVRIDTFYEMRAHHSETFWTKLALAGATIIQVGVEAISDNVLKLIAKGTTVAQNILAEKYMKELNITSTSNLITHYPASTVQDVEDTKNLLMRIPHFPKFHLVSFMMVMGSPLFEKLSESERKNLQQYRLFTFPSPLDRLQVDFGFAIPEGHISAEAIQAWNDFYSWYGNFLAETNGPNISLTCERLIDGRMRIVDWRQTSSRKTMYFNEEAAKIYDQTHDGCSAKVIAKNTGCSLETVNEWLKEFDQKELVYFINGVWIALALRSRDVLISRYLASELAKNEKNNVVQLETTKQTHKTLPSVTRDVG